MIIELLKGFPVHTITCDNGKEFAAHEEISRALEAKTFFAHPYALWERGTNENTNGLIRQYFPKGTDFTQVSEDEINEVQRKLNDRPRKALNFNKPDEAFNNVVALEVWNHNLINTLKKCGLKSSLRGF